MKLEKLGFLWRIVDRQNKEAWDAMLNKLKTYRNNNEGDLHVPRTTPNSSDRPLARWVKTQRELMKKGKLLPDRQARLEELGFQWEVKGGRYRNREKKDRTPIKTEPEVGQKRKTMDGETAAEEKDSKMEGGDNLPTDKKQRTEGEKDKEDGTAEKDSTKRKRDGDDKSVEGEEDDDEEMDSPSSKRTKKVANLAARGRAAKVKAAAPKAQASKARNTRAKSPVKGSPTKTMSGENEPEDSGRSSGRTRGKGNTYYV